ncbi:MAG: LLM class flavin-dependent oxidoreductase [Deltaproteobacteria bacterium]|nr:LLM class flavin-dependent oxidoreductase [Deltaproteobacteria bacterium]MBW2393465.1 LLM class flavin-dependent oxidoreductase [Deltaproteobacteria bacterium]
MTNTETSAPRHWSVLQPLPAPILVEMARQAEAMGIHGCFAPQVMGPPFLPLAVAAGVTERLQLASGIAIAAARSPFETAMAAIDMDRISGGRFTLGLGASVQAWSHGVFGAPVHKPVTHLRETVEAVRHIVRGAHKGLEPFEGEYYQADFKELQPTAPPVREEIPIWVAALRAPMVRMAARVADGLIGHPMWSIEWARETMAPELDRALEAAGRSRSEIEVNIWPWAAPNPNEAEAIEDARPTIAFYGGVKQYESFFEAHGYLDVARKLQEGVQRGDFMSVAHLVPDEMVRTFVSVGEPEKVRERIGKLDGLADSICIVPPAYGLSPEKAFFYATAIAETFQA